MGWRDFYRPVDRIGNPMINSALLVISLTLVCASFLVMCLWWVATDVEDRTPTRLG
jgi:hypothetical protein